MATFHEAARLFQGMPGTTSKAQYSLAFALAVMLAYGRIGTEHVTGPGLRDPEVAALVGCVSIRERDRHSARFPAGRWSDVTITLKDGRVLASGDVVARGGPEAPLSTAEVRAKFDGLCAPALSPERGASIWAAGEALVRDGSRFADLAGLVEAPPDANAA